MQVIERVCFKISLTNATLRSIKGGTTSSNNFTWRLGSRFRENFRASTEQRRSNKIILMKGKVRMNGFCRLWYAPALLLFAMLAVVIGCGNSSSHDPGASNVSVRPRSLTNGLRYLTSDGEVYEINSDGFGLETDSGEEDTKGHGLIVVQERDPGGGVTPERSDVQVRWVYEPLSGVKARLSFEVQSSTNTAFVPETMAYVAELTFQTKESGTYVAEYTGWPGGPVTHLEGAFSLSD